MENGIKKIEYVIEKIEESITREIDCEALAAEMMLSLYEFRRIFAFVVGCPLSEYVRKRRLSLAAAELMTSPSTPIKAIGEKYGYSTVAAFSKAFREMHGVSPSVCQGGGKSINLFTRPKFEFSVKGRSSVPFTVINDRAFSIKGIAMRSPLADSCCCDAVWQEFYDGGYDQKISSDRIYASYKNDGGEVLCTIGERVDSGQEEILSHSYAVFVMNTTDDGAVNEKYGEILYEILPSAGLKRIESLPTMEVFPYDMSENNFEWEIRIPIEKE